MTAAPARAGYVFDEAGQLTARPGSKQTYDAKGRLTSVTLDDGTVVAYRYDYAGMVAVKETTGPRGHHRTVYADKLAEERDGELVDYVFAAGLRIARVGGEHLDPIAAGMMRLPPVTGATGDLHVAGGVISWLFRPAHRRRVPALAAFGLALLMFNVGCGGDGPTAAAPSLNGAVYYHHDHLGGVVLETDEHGRRRRRGLVRSIRRRSPAAADEPYAFTGKERDPADRPLRLRRPRLRPEAGAVPLSRSRASRRSRAGRRGPAATLDLQLHPQQPDQPHRSGRPVPAHPRAALWSAA